MGGLDSGERQQVINNKAQGGQEVALEHYLEVSNPDVDMGERLYFSSKLQT